MNIIERLTMAGIACTLFLQVCASIWWAGSTDARVDNIETQVAIHKEQQKDYPAIINRVETVERAITNLVMKLEDLIDLMHKEREFYSDFRYHKHDNETGQPGG